MRMQYDWKKSLNSPPITDAILEKLAKGSCLTAWASGSLVEGLGNAGSDFDVYVAVASPKTGKNVVRREGLVAIVIDIVDARRIDYEYWPTSRITQVAEKLRSLPLDEPDRNILDSLSLVEKEFIHRLKCGLPIVNPGNFRRLQSLFDFAKYRRYLVDNQIHYVNDAFDDAVGMLESGDIECAAIRALDTIGFSVDALLYSQDFTTDKPKYRCALLSRLAGRNRGARNFRRRFWDFQSIPKTRTGRISYVKNALRFSSEIIEYIENETNTVQPE